MYNLFLLFTYPKFINISFPHAHYQHIVYSWAFFLGVQHEIFDAQHMAREVYKQDIDGPRMQEGLQEAMLQTRCKAREQHQSQLVKFLLVVDPSLGDDFLTQLKLHWSHAKVGHEEMTQEKMVNVAITEVDLQEKVEWLHIWNGDQAIKN
jgi:hypothetical protein